MGLITALVVGAHVSKSLYKNSKNMIQGMHVANWVEEQEALPTHMRDTKYDAFYRDASLRQVMAMLVDGVYSRDRAAVDFHLIVKPFLEGAYAVDERTEYYTRICWTQMELDVSDQEEEKRVGIRHYLRIDPHPNRLAPRLVIAFRGTKLSSIRDLVDDMKIAGHKLDRDNSSRFKSCEELVEKLIKCFCQRYNGRAEEISIAGHSLGAAMALLIARNLATGNKGRYSVHCFNPPFLTMLMLIEKCLFIEKTRDFLNKIRLVTPLLKGDELAVDVAKKILTHIVADPNILMEERRNFASLVDWVPELYVNKYDRICKEYLRYYIRKHKKFSESFMISSQALVTRLLGKNVKYSSLMPSVNMHISKKKKGSHDLKQWYTESGLVVEVQKFRLMGPRPPVYLEIDYNTRSIILDEQDTVSDSASEVESSDSESSDDESSNSEYRFRGSSTSTQGIPSRCTQPLLGCTDPSHSLALLESTPYIDGTYTCDLCCHQGNAAVYHCTSCGSFDLHPSCANITSEVVSFTHPHQLSLQPPYSRDNALCDGCLHDTDGTQWVYRCSTSGCDFDIHARCAKYARTIFHPIHKEHVLVLIKESRNVGPHQYVVQCDGCFNPVHPNQLVYHCEVCGFDIHPSCVLGSTC
ncbi:hypothetical protein KC19_4G144900 [Ceratodon purpureus]|uniref:Uncharacterized protein n=1 Tax=Ceratodon purpureus TaxID=3225 RepID=A0A8T0IC56_CERPU|nr:hypothetical protein KC19_4G144900 [Ceratodon purpureus]